MLFRMRNEEEFHNYLDLAPLSLKISGHLLRQAQYITYFV